VFVSHPAYIRAKARQLRAERRLTIDQIAQRLALPRTTIFYWVRDLPLARDPVVASRAQAAATRAMQAKYRLAREAAYEDGRATFMTLCADPTFRDFVCLYLAEGYKRRRNCVSVCNSDPAVIRLCNSWLRRLAPRKRHAYSIQHHADQDPGVLRAFWATQLAIDAADIRLQRKSNSNQLAARSWRSVHGVLAVTVYDTQLRARMEAWMDCLRESWLRLDASGCSSAW
jgi:AcrR family transcriptional regulator